MNAQRTCTHLKLVGLYDTPVWKELFVKVVVMSFLMLATGGLPIIPRNSINDLC